MNKYWIIALSGGILLLCLAAALVMIFTSPEHQTIRLSDENIPAVQIVKDAIAEQETPKIALRNVSQSQLDYAEKYQIKWEVQPGARILIIPHQLSQSREIMGALGAMQPPSVIYLVAPDNDKICKTSICTTDHGFETEAGGLRGSADYVAKFTKSIPEITIDDSVFTGPGSATYLIPLIAKKWSGLRVIPILVDPQLSGADAELLAGALTSALTYDREAGLIVALESNREISSDLARFQSAATEDIISALADLESDQTIFDSPQLLSVALKTARNLKMGEVSVETAFSTSTNQTASYVYGWFSPGEIQQQESATLLFLGDIMLDRFVAERSRRAGSKNYPFLDVAGPHGEFFHGQDAVIANLEGPVTSRRSAPDKGEVDFMFDPAIAPLLKEIGIHAVSQANNHTLDQGRLGADESRKLLSEAGVTVFGDQVKDDAESALAVINVRGQKVALLGFNDTDNPLNKTDAEAAIKSAYEQARYVVVYMHWGAEYQSKPNMSQIELAHWFIDQGVDAVIGSHPHWMQSVEVYNNRPIIYSLGNFIFDQDWSVETNYGLIVGLNLSPDGTEIQLFPIQLTESQPQILEGVDRQTRLDRLANISNESLKDQIKSGLIHISQ